MDHKILPNEDAASHQQTLASEPQPQTIDQARPRSPDGGKPHNLTRANTRIFDKAAEIEEARRNGIAIPEGNVGLADCSSTSSERHAKALEQVRLRVAPEFKQQLAEAHQYFDDNKARHGEEFQLQLKREWEQQNAERERIRMAAIDEALERIRKIPDHQAPTLKQLGDLPWAEEEAWYIRSMEPRGEMDTDAAIQPDSDVPEPSAADAPTPQPPSQDDSHDGMQGIDEGGRPDLHHESTAAAAPHETGGEDGPRCTRDSDWLEMLGSWESGREPWLIKQQRLAREREQMGQSQDERGQAQQDTRLEGHVLPSTSSDLPRFLLPANFPRYHNIHGMNDMGAYLANASYAVSLGGPPSADLKYGIIVVPVGEEATLFGQQPSDVMTPSFVQQVYDARYTRQVAARDDFHEASHDSADFLRPRYKSVVADDRSLHSLGDLVDPAVTAGRDKGHDLHKGSAMPRTTALARARAPESTDSTSKAVDTDRNAR